MFSIVLKTLSGTTRILKKRTKGLNMLQPVIIFPAPTVAWLPPWRCHRSMIVFQQGAKNVERNFQVSKPFCCMDNSDAVIHLRGHSLMLWIHWNSNGSVRISFIILLCKWQFTEYRYNMLLDLLSSFASYRLQNAFSLVGRRLLKSRHLEPTM